MDFDEFWKSIFAMKNTLGNPMFSHLSVLVKGIISLPHSSAAAERVFSALYLIKTKTRNRLNVETCDAILHSKSLLGNLECHSWVPSESLMKRKVEYRK